MKPGSPFCRIGNCAGNVQLAPNNAILQSCSEVGAGAAQRDWQRSAGDEESITLCFNQPHAPPTWRAFSFPYTASCIGREQARSAG